MRTAWLLPTILLLVPTLPHAQVSPAPAPPVANKVHTEKPINGGVLVDDYAWLRNRTDPHVHAYLEAENAYAEQFTAGQKPFAEALYNETLGHIKQTDTTVGDRTHQGAAGASRGSIERR
jgi:oligopeptidase B